MNQQLITAALEVRQRAYAPYSKFRVGAAILTAEGTVFCGCNVENASYGLTICAERNAAAAAVSAGATEFVAVAVAAAGGAAPCGACRQFLAEFGPNMECWLVDPESPDAIRTLTLGELLPHQFRLDPGE